MWRVPVSWIVAAGACFGHDPITTKITWTQEISRIVGKRCLGCHGSGSAVPLGTYAEARPWAKAIRDQVLTRQMPPWGAVHGVGDFRDDPSLTEAEMERVVQWVEGGAPEGDAAYLPPPREIDKPKPFRMRAPVRVTAGRDLVIGRDTACEAIRPDSPGEASALFPDGRVEHLIWLRDYHGLTYVFRKPVLLPKGTAVRVTSGSALLNLTPAQGRPSAALLDLPPSPSIATH